MWSCQHWRDQTGKNWPFEMVPFKKSGYIKGPETRGIPVYPVLLDTDGVITPPNGLVRPYKWVTRVITPINGVIIRTFNWSSRGSLCGKTL